MKRHIEMTYAVSIEHITYTTDQNQRILAERIYD